MGVIKRLLGKRPPSFVLISPETTVLRATSLMAQCQIGIVVVAKGGIPIGVFSERDLLRRVIAKGLSPRETPVRKVMTLDPITARASDPCKLAALMMSRRGCRHLPIIDEEGKVVEMLSMRDLLTDEIEEAASEIEAMQDYMRGPWQDEAQEGMA